MTHGLILLLPAKPDEERDSVAHAWSSAGGSVVRLDRFWEPPQLDRTRARLYGSDAFCLVLAQQLSLDLVSPPDDLVARIDPQWTKRKLATARLEDLGSADFPAFLKPVVPKQFRAAVYAGLGDLDREVQGLAQDTEVIVSEPVCFSSEARAFLLRGQVQACSVYEGVEPTSDATEFAATVAGSMELPVTCVIDVGRMPDRGWGVVEFNATWGAGLNGCNAEDVIDCIAVATRTG